jgi:pimeloyl-ACP methyl ester carboxylesterase
MSEANLYLEDQGIGSPALIFLHYFAGSSRSWAHVAERVSTAHRCLRIDVPGFGRSRPLSTYGVEEVAQVITGAVAGLRLERFVLVGHSMGGKLAMACAVAQPPGLVGLILVAPSPPSPEPMDEQVRSNLLTSHGDRTSAEHTLHSITRRSLSAEDFATCIADNLLTSAEAWRWWLTRGSREDITVKVSRIVCPVLVLAGSEDPVIPPHVVESQVTPKFANAKCVQIVGCGHLLPLEAAPDVSLAIEGFIPLL